VKSKLDLLGRSASSGDDPRLGAALEEYFERLNAGERPAREEWLARYPEIADELGECLDGLLFVHSASPLSARLEGEAELPEVVGEFQIIRELGRGGMGVVYEAIQVSLGRRVALKILPRPGAIDPRQRQRFQVEAQAAAQLNHAHIVPVFAFGVDRGIHFYAMSYIAGRTLAAIIDGLRTAAHAGTAAGTDPFRSEAHGAGEPGGTACVPAIATPSRRDTEFAPIQTGAGFFREVARIGLQAAEALEHAHEWGVVHRDVKPSNLMIDGRGDLWVTDFGLARLQGDSALTQSGDLLGTLRYMSPEQAQARRAAVDHRTDIYSLGATLYELVTLRPPFIGRDRQELLNQIALDDPVPPRRLNAAAPRDLETVILKAMAKDLAARYSCAGDLAADLRRVLEGRPVLARPSSGLDRASKWVRRRRAAIVAAAGALLVSLSASTGLLWVANTRTNTALRHQRESGLEQFRALKQSLTLIELMTSVNESESRAAGSAPGGSADQLNQTAILFYDDIARRFAHDERMSEVVAGALRGAGRRRMTHGQPAGRRDFRDAIRLYEAAAARTPGQFWLRAALIETLEEYTRLLDQPDDAAEAHAVRARAVAIADQWVADADANQSCVSTRLAAPLNNLAWELVKRPPADPGVAARAVRLARKATETGPGDFAAWNTLALALGRSGDTDGARAALEKAVALHSPDVSDWLVLALLRAQTGDGAGASQALEHADALAASPVVPDLEGLRQEARRMAGSIPSPKGTDDSGSRRLHQG
jgi:serine/threonine protein kinase/Flp pilus assembly protein TadD